MELDIKKICLLASPEVCDHPNGQSSGINKNVELTENKDGEILWH